MTLHLHFSYLGFFNLFLALANVFMLVKYAETPSARAASTFAVLFCGGMAIFCFLT